ncbi:MAG: alcohol dehydrogenase catalytic domain-containing protein [Bacteroidota bacterium]
MKAWQIKAYGTNDVFKLVEIPNPTPKAGWVIIQIRAFGLNRSELYTRQGHSGDAVSLPRVLGIECVGEVIHGGGADLQPGQQVAAAMGSMGRLYDGGYAERTQVPRSNVFPVKTTLGWEAFGALPETINTAYATPVLQTIVDKVTSGGYLPNIHQVFSFATLPLAMEMMENNQAVGKLVVRVP